MGYFTAQHYGRIVDFKNVLLTPQETRITKSGLYFEKIILAAAASRSTAF